MGTPRSPAIAFLLAAAALPISGAGTSPTRPIRSDWHLRYETLESEPARSLLEKALAFGRTRLGDPAIPIRRVQLRKSIPLEGKVQIRRGFQLTEITDSEKGIFTIYLSALPGEVAFPGQLAHEAFHLFNARIRDAYVEGLNCLMAEEFIRGEGLSWEPWERHFESGKDPLYGASYFLARDLAGAAGREALAGMLRFAVETSHDPDRMEIDIDRWLDSLGAAARSRAIAAIEKRFDGIDSVRKKDQPDLAFRRPGARD